MLTVLLLFVVVLSHLASSSSDPMLTVLLLLCGWRWFVGWMCFALVLFVFVSSGTRVQAVRKRREVAHDLPCSDLLRELIELCTRQLAEDFHAGGQAAAPPAARVSSVPASAEVSAGGGPAAAAVTELTELPPTLPPLRAALLPVSAAAGPSEPSSLAACVGNLTVGKKRGRCWSWAEQLSAAGGVGGGVQGAEAPRSGAGGGGSGGALGGGGGGGGGGSSSSGVCGTDGLIRAFGLCDEMAMLDSPPLSAKRCKGPGGGGRKDKRDKDKEREQREWEKLNRK